MTETIEYFSNPKNLDLIGQAFVFLVFLDIILGFSKAWANKTFVSSIARKGIVSHFGVLVLFIGAKHITYNLDIDEVHGIANTMTIGVCISYLISIVENLDEMGVPYIKKLANLLKEREGN